jgi:hypothetical protein
MNEKESYKIIIPKIIKKKKNCKEKDIRKSILLKRIRGDD